MFKNLLYLQPDKLNKNEALTDHVDQNASRAEGNKIQGPHRGPDPGRENKPRPVDQHRFRAAHRRGSDQARCHRTREEKCPDHNGPGPDQLRVEAVRDLAGGEGDAAACGGQGSVQCFLRAQNTGRLPERAP